MSVPSSCGACLAEGPMMTTTKQHGYVFCGRCYARTKVCQSCCADEKTLVHIKHEGYIVCRACGVVQRGQVLSEEYYDESTAGNEVLQPGALLGSFVSSKDARKRVTTGVPTKRQHSVAELSQAVNYAADPHLRRVDRAEKIVSDLCGFMQLHERVQTVAKYMVNVVERDVPEPSDDGSAIEKSITPRYSAATRAVACVIVACRRAKMVIAMGPFLERAATVVGTSAAQRVNAFLVRMESYVPVDYQNAIDASQEKMGWVTGASYRYCVLARSIIGLVVDRSVIKGENPMPFVVAALVIASAVKRRDEAKREPIQITDELIARVHSDLDSSVNLPALKRALTSVLTKWSVIREEPNTGHLFSDACISAMDGPSLLSLHAFARKRPKR